MIHVNLLPHALRPVKRTPIPYIVSGLITVLAFLGVGYVYTNTQGQIDASRARLDEYTRQFNQLEAVVADYNAMVATKRTLSLKIETINEIVRDRIIWSEQLYNLTRVLPENAWVSDMRVEIRRETETQTVWDPQTKKNVPKQVTISRRILAVSGYVVEGEEGETKVAALVRNVEEDEDFSRMFELRNTSLGDTTFDDFRVKEFRLEFEILGTQGAAS